MHHSYGLKSWRSDHVQCAGTNNVNLNKAQALGIKVIHVPSYSPEAVAEFAVGMMLTTIRKYHKCYNRVREGNFLLTGIPHSLILKHPAIVDRIQDS